METNVTETSFVAPDISCGGCAASIHRALGQKAGIERVAVDVTTKIVTVSFDAAKTGAEAIAETLTDIGFPPEVKERG